MFLLHSTPLIGRTRTAPPLIFPIQRNMGSALNTAAHQAVEFALRQFFRRPFNQWRRAACVRPLQYVGWDFDALPGLTIPMLYGHSPVVLPRPDDWPAHWHVTGCWFLDAELNWQPPPELLAFLSAGAPPIYIGFGSMASRQPEQMTRIVLDALRRTGRRVVLATGWGGLSFSDLPDHVFAAGSVPHDWLFPQVAAVVHHGGAGTTFAGLRAGIPSIIVPHFGDQFFWGQRLCHLGVGVHPIPRHTLNAWPQPLKRRWAVGTCVSARPAWAAGFGLKMG